MTHPPGPAEGRRIGPTLSSGQAEGRRISPALSSGQVQGRRIGATFSSGPAEGRRIGAILLFCLFSAMLLVACGSSAGLESVSASSFNKGAEDSQYVRFLMAFDRPMTTDQFRLRIRLANMNVKEEKIRVERGAKENQLIVTLQVDRSRDGNITFMEGKKARLEALIPSGVQLITKNTTQGAVTVEVTHRFNIRCIAWVMFSEEGKPVGASLMGGAEERDGAIAVHGHEFLTDDEYAVASALAEALKSHFGDRYDFSVDGKNVTAVAKTGNSGRLSIEIYEYLRLSG